MCPIGPCVWTFGPQLVGVVCKIIQPFGSEVLLGRKWVIEGGFALLHFLFSLRFWTADGTWWLTCVYAPVSSRLYLLRVPNKTRQWLFFLKALCQGHPVTENETSIQYPNIVCAHLCYACPVCSFLYVRTHVLYVRTHVHSQSEQNISRGHVCCQNSLLWGLKSAFDPYIWISITTS